MDFKTLLGYTEKRLCPMCILPGQEKKVLKQCVSKMFKICNLEIGLCNVIFVWCKRIMDAMRGRATHKRSEMITSWAVMLVVYRRV